MYLCFECVLIFIYNFVAALNRTSDTGIATNNANNNAGLQQPMAPAIAHNPNHQQQMPLRLPSVDRDISNSGSNNYLEENKCYKVSVSFDRYAMRPIIRKAIETFLRHRPKCVT